MKYNPKRNERLAALPGLAAQHPYQDEDTLQGLLEILYGLQEDLAAIAGLDAVSLQPAAGAQGELTALLVAAAYYRDRNEQRTQVLIPDSAHGTNPASANLAGLEAVTIKSDARGLVDLNDFRAKLSDQTAVFMITNPNTVGLFDPQIGEISKLLRERGALLYLDGANMNAIVGVSRPGDFGVDVMHYNTHKTFSTPHGCGGPGAGPIAVRKFLSPYLPVPQVEKRNRAAGNGGQGGSRAASAGTEYFLDSDRTHSIGKVRSFFGQFGILLRCWTYIAACGPDGLRNVGQTAVLNANYLAARLRDRFEMPYFKPEQKKFAAHEFVTVPRSLLSRGVTLVDIAKRLIDYGIHPPTMHWPVHDCLMVEPTETESLATLDRFVETMNQIADEIERDPQSLKEAPRQTPVRRLDEVAAARTPVLTAS